MLTYSTSGLPLMASVMPSIAAMASTALGIDTAEEVRPSSVFSDSTLSTSVKGERPCTRASLGAELEVAAAMVQRSVRGGDLGGWKPWQLEAEGGWERDALSWAKSLGFRVTDD